MLIVTAAQSNHNGLTAVPIKSLSQVPSEEPTFHHLPIAESVSAASADLHQFVDVSTTFNPRMCQVIIYSIAGLTGPLFRSQMIWIIHIRSSMELSRVGLPHRSWEWRSLLLYQARIQIDYLPCCCRGGQCRIRRNARIPICTDEGIQYRPCFPCNIEGRSIGFVTRKNGGCTSSGIYHSFHYWAIGCPSGFRA